MNALVVYHSKFGNTKRVAVAVAETLQADSSVRVLSADALTAAGVGGIDLLVAGTPTHIANLPRELRSILEALPKGVLKGVSVAAFDTSYNVNWFVNTFTAAKPLARKLRRLGGKQLAPPKSFFVVDREGPLYDGEIGRATAWAETICARLRAASQPGHIRLQ